MKTPFSFDTKSSIALESDTTYPVYLTYNFGYVCWMHSKNINAFTRISVNQIGLVRLCIEAANNIVNSKAQTWNSLFVEKYFEKGSGNPEEKLRFED